MIRTQDIGSYLSELFVANNYQEIQSLKNDVNSYIDLIKEGKGGDNQDYSFTDDEVNYIKSKMNKYITYLKPQLLSAKIKILSGSPAFALFGLNKTLSAGTNSDYLNLLSKYFFNFTLDIITSTSTESYPAGFIKDSLKNPLSMDEKLFLPKFINSPLKLADYYGKYSDLRSEAISMYTSGSISQSKFFKTDKNELKKKLEDKINSLLNTIAIKNSDNKKIDINDSKTYEGLEFYKYGKDWILDNKKILELL